jgi:hypothetical protein
MTITCFVTQMSLTSNRVDLHPEVKDDWGLPAERTVVSPSMSAYSARATASRIAALLGLRQQSDSSGHARRA